MSGKKQLKKREVAPAKGLRGVGVRKTRRDRSHPNLKKRAIKIETGNYLV
jgi:hypothetical protein